MKFSNSLRQKTGHVDVQVSLLTCSIVIVSCIIMFFVTFSIMKSILRDVYGFETDIAYGMISSRIEDNLYEEDLTETDRDKAYSYLSAMRENMMLTDIIIYRSGKDGNPEYVIDTKHYRDNGGALGASVTDVTQKDLKKLIDGTYYGNGDFYKIDGRLRYMKFYPVYDKGRKVKGAVGIASDADDLYVAEQILRVLFFVIIILGCLISIKFANTIFKRISNPLYQDSSNTDSLTGCKNKNSYTVDLHNIELSKPDGYSVISVDMNGLKPINDTKGHQAGDMYLRRTSSVIHKAVENEGAVCYRVGGDEFIVIMKDKTLKELEAAAKRIDEFTAQENRENSGLNLSMSVGYALFDAERDRNFSTTVERSDKMMYENKRLFYQKKNMEMR